MPLKTCTPSAVVPTMRPDAVSTTGEPAVRAGRSDRIAMSPATVRSPVPGGTSLRVAPAAGQPLKSWVAALARRLAVAWSARHEQRPPTCIFGLGRDESEVVATVGRCAFVTLPVDARLRELDAGELLLATAVDRADTKLAIDVLAERLGLDHQPAALQLVGKIAVGSGQRALAFGNHRAAQAP